MSNGSYGLTIVETNEYAQRKEQHGSDPCLLDDIQRSFDLILANDPYLGEAVPFYPHVYVLRTTPYPPRVPSFRVLYRYDPADNPQQIELLALQPLPIEEES